MRIGSLFSGIGGLEMGVQTVVGGDVVWQCEHDRHASTVLAERFPGVTNHGDITATDWTTVESVDLICGGFPCQSSSTAGKRLGWRDPRWLWPAFASAIEAVKPSYVVIENVRGLLSVRDEFCDAPDCPICTQESNDHDDHGTDRPAMAHTATTTLWTGFGDVLRDLASLGFDAEWQVFRSSDIGAPHARNRLFCIATDPKGVIGERPSSVGSRRRQPEEQTRGHCRSTAHTNDVGREGFKELHGDSDSRRSWGARYDVNGCGVDRGRLGDRTRAGDVGGWGKFWPAVDRWERIIGRSAPAPVDERGRLNPALPEWMQGYPAGWVTDVDVPRSAQLRMLGNAVQPQTAELAVSSLLARTEQMSAAA